LIQLESETALKERLKIKTDYIIGMVASFSKHKDYKTYFESAQRVLEKRNDVTFLAIGSDTDSSEAKKMIQDNYVCCFRLLGKRRDAESLINIMDIAVLSTFTEGISNSILEYMALGKPVIATEGGGTNEIIVDGITGFLVKRSDVQELSDKMMSLLNNHSLRTNMGSAAKQRICDYFSIEKMIKGYTNVYRSLCDN
jgi:glycosyltransferase involved in cell wall biosynthesis